jgi:hypothetical protein
MYVSPFSNFAWTVTLKFLGAIFSGALAVWLGILYATTLYPQWLILFCALVIWNAITLYKLHKVMTSIFDLLAEIDKKEVTQKENPNA